MKKGYKTLRYRLEKEEETARLAQLTQKMYSAGLISDNLRMGEAFKVLTEMVLTMDIVHLEHIKEFKRYEIDKLKR